MTGENTLLALAGLVVLAASYVSGAAVAGAVAAAVVDPLPSWNDQAAKQAILRFVRTVTQAGSAAFVSAPERIAVFDNDGTLWAEKPLPFQMLFGFDRVKALAPQRQAEAGNEGGQAGPSEAAHRRVRQRQGGQKPVGIESRIGRRPIGAFGNSDGDLQMLQVSMKDDWKAVFPVSK